MLKTFEFIKAVSDTVLEMAVSDTVLEMIKCTHQMMGDRIVLSLFFFLDIDSIILLNLVLLSVL